MTQWTYIVAAYALTFAGTLAVIIASYVAMRRAEKALSALQERDA